VWHKSKASNFFLAKKRPMKHHEDICVFYKRLPTYNPQMTPAEDHLIRVRPNEYKSNIKEDSVLGGGKVAYRRHDNGLRYPQSVQHFNNSDKNNIVHPTQKPVALFEYLIRTYTNEGELVLDNVIGSGTTAVAAINTGRQFIGIEREEEYVNIARERVKQAYAERSKTEVMSND